MEVLWGKYESLFANLDILPGNHILGCMAYFLLGQCHMIGKHGSDSESVCSLDHLIGFPFVQVCKCIMLFRLIVSLFEATIVRFHNRQI